MNWSHILAAAIHFESLVINGQILSYRDLVGIAVLFRAEVSHKTSRIRINAVKRFFEMFIIMPLCYSPNFLLEIWQFTFTQMAIHTFVPSGP